MKAFHSSSSVMFQSRFSNVAIHLQEQYQDRRCQDKDSSLHDQDAGTQNQNSIRNCPALKPPQHNIIFNPQD